MKRKFAALIALLIAGILCFAGCGGGGSDVELDPDGNVRPGSKVTNITFWGYGDDEEIQVFRKLTESFNELYKDAIHVEYVQKVSDGYPDNLRVTLGGSKGPDVCYVGDSDYKTLAEYGYLEPLDEYIAMSKEVVPSEMWESSVNRYRYDVDTTTMDGPNAKYWGVPKDIGPTVIFYNETFFKQAGITVISVAAEDLAKFNAGEPDSRGKTKSDYAITGEVKEKGYFELGGKKYFNNQVPMSWDETVACSALVQDKSSAEHGYFTEWWFNYGWSVGGDCVQYVPTTDSAYNGGYWDFTLMDPTKNYIVADNNTAGFTVNGTKYEAGEILAWQDKLTDPKAQNRTIRQEVLAAVREGKLNELPSQREAFVEFVRMGQKKTVAVDTMNGQTLYGYGVTPSPTSIGGDAGKTIAFAQGNVAMLVDGRWNVPNFRRQMDSKYEWDVAPLPMYKEYDSQGNITVHGVEAGHSGSVAVCINQKSKYKNAAWKFIEYIAGRTDQKEQSLSGFAIPSQKDLANSEVFLQTNQNPRNSIVFVRAAAIETPGDWWYLRDKKWIDPWAGLLNGSVRNGQMTLSQFEVDEKFTRTYETLKEYTKKS